MLARFNFIEINYHSHREICDPRVVIQKHLPSNLFAQPLLKYAKVTLVKHMDHTGEISENGIQYYFFKRPNRFFQIPSRTHRAVKELKPDLVLVQGFIFPWQVIILRRIIGKGAVILLQHHKESPGGKKRFFQRIADRYVDGYLFTALGSAREWITARIIKTEKCFEFPSASTSLIPLDKQKSRETIGMNDGIHFLWVGRLIRVKDPMTILKGFEQYLVSGGDACLWMIFDKTDLLQELNAFISKSPVLSGKVRMVGEVVHRDLSYWFSAADYYISGSWNEGGSYALTEAMACGCVPVVSDIPPAMHTIDQGNAGYYFEKGNSESLFQVLCALDHRKREEMSLKAAARFKSQYSAEAIVEKLLSIYWGIKNLRDNLATK